MGDRIGKIQRDVRSVQGAVWLMAGLTALSATILGYVLLLGANISQDTSQLIVNAISALSLASVISLLAFVGLTVVYRMKLDRQREEGRQLVTKWLASRSGKLATAPWSGGCGEGAVIETFPASAQGDHSPRQTAANSPD